MVGRRGLLLRQRPSWPIVHQEAPSMAYALYETAWALAWPHLDDWFKGRDRIWMTSSHPGALLT